MNKLLSTTALALALGLPSMALAQSAAETNSENSSTMQTESGEMSGFMSARSQSDVFASELMGHDVYARSTSSDQTMTEGQGDENNGMAMMNSADIEDMDNIGQINEIVLSKDGEVLALVIGVGGFLGMGEQDVAVAMDQVTIASDQDDRTQMYVVLNSGSDTLEGAPAYDRSAMREGDSMDDTGVGDSDRAAMDDGSATDMSDTNEMDRAAMDDGSASDGSGAREEDRTAFTSPDVEREGYKRVEATQVSSDTLTGQSVYDPDDQSVGTVDDLIVGDNGEITNVIIDFGGFLGIGSSQVSLDFNELTVMSSENGDDVRVYVDATEQQIRDLPQYEPMN